MSEGRASVECVGHTTFFQPNSTRGPVALDEQQHKLLELTPEESVVVLGAAGTGKTVSVIEFVHHKLARDLRPENLLALSPNRHAATRLRDALALRIQQATEGPMARTPLSLAFEIAQKQAELTHQEPPRLLTGSEQDSILADILHGHIVDHSGPMWPDPLVPELRMKRAFRSELRDLYARCTEMGWSAQELEEQGVLRNVPQWIAAASVWSEYLDVVSSFRQSSFDSSEILALATVAMDNPCIMPELTLLVIDDAQELTRGMISFVRACVRRGVSVVALGDPDTAVTVFRGAMPEFLGRFETELEIPQDKVQRITLDKVYRHGPRIRSIVQRTTHFGTAQAGTQRNASSAVADAARHPVVGLQRSSRHTELAAVAGQLRTHHLLGNVPWSNMVVVVRNGHLVPHVAKALAVAEVPTRTLMSERTLNEYGSVVDIVSIIAVAMGKLPMNLENVQLLLRSSVGGMTPLDIRRLRMALRHNELAEGGTRTGEEILLAAFLDHRELLTLDFYPAKKASSLAQLIDRLTQEINTGSTIEELLWSVWSHSGLAQLWSQEALGTGLIAEEANFHLDGVMALFTAAKRYVERYPSRPASQFIAEMLEADVPEDTLAPQSLHESVLVCTPSALIGAEFEVVAVAAVQESTWPNLKPRGTLLHALDVYTEGEPAQLDFAAERKTVLLDELRMFVLALSRARTHLVISATANDDDLPSAFVTALDNEIRSTENVLVTHSEENFSLRSLVGSLRRDLTASLRSPSKNTDVPLRAAALAKLASHQVHGAHPRDWYGVQNLSSTAPLVDLGDPDATVSVSPSKLETWEKNQLAWFIQSIVGHTSTTATGIGSIIHKVMEDASEPGADISVESLWDQVAHRWHELSFEAAWLDSSEQARAKKMIEALHQYLSDFENEGKHLISSEGGFELETGRAKVRGFIDRVEQDSFGRVVIVDLKTGKYTPAQGDIPEHAQLACYQLALAEKKIEGLPADAQPGGAKLIYVTNGVRGKLYREFVQEEYDEVALNEIRRRIENASSGMAGATFSAPVIISQEISNPFSRYEFRIHSIPEVSSS